MLNHLIILITGILGLSGMWLEYLTGEKAFPKDQDAVTRIVVVKFFCSVCILLTTAWGISISFDIEEDKVIHEERYLEQKASYAQLKATYTEALKNGEAVTDLTRASQDIVTILNDVKDTISSTRAEQQTRLKRIDRVNRLIDPLPEILEPELDFRFNLEPYLKTKFDLIAINRGVHKSVFLASNFKPTAQCLRDDDLLILYINFSKDGRRIAQYIAGHNFKSEYGRSSFSLLQVSSSSNRNYEAEGTAQFKIIQRGEFSYEETLKSEMSVFVSCSFTRFKEGDRMNVKIPIKKGFTEYYSLRYDEKNRRFKQF